MKHLLQILTFALVLTACVDKQKEIKETTLPPISEVYDSFYEGSLALDPLFGNFFGINRYLDTLPNNLTDEFRAKEVAHYQTHLDKIQQYDRTQLNESDQLNYDIIVWYTKNRLAANHNFVKYLPINQLSSVNLYIAQLASGSSTQPFVTVQDYDNWIKRLKDYNVWLDTALANMKEGITLGYVQPKSIVKKIIPQFEEMAKGPVEAHLFYSPVKNMPEGFTEAEKSAIEIKYRKTIEEDIIPRYQKLAEFFKTDYLDAARSTSGIGPLPASSEHYKNQIEYMTSTNLSADSIFNLGKSEVARIRIAMELVKKEVGFEGSLVEFFNHVRTKKDLMPYTDPQQVLNSFDTIQKRMAPQLAKLFDKKPKTPFMVKRTEAFREKSASAQYNPGNPDGSRPGVFYVPIPDVTSYNVNADEALFLHEAIPGHHYQVMLAAENESIPAFRKFTYSGAYIEGWGLYAESLGKELGLYEDPYQYFGMLSMEMHRAIRLVVDVGLHDKGWTREEAIAYSLDNEAFPEAGIISEIERYMVEPAQPLSYKIGQLTILRLRQEAEKALGDDFDIKAFHNTILDAGDMPLAVLE
ncbi:DUF885 domain-containing protein [Aequorivita antarctica]|uniref:DUF885 domain-containing protein n=1 Tax=Aequorivita antarctica TaxID=153266 RepID=A0A5C6YXL0_9FLAO|nr:DUF885 domain-containing protein [Aequorivita antarctica]TXD72338.1 DUF885 domain-containing protein [Aequorivita antarctica]SRX74479.1 hypothetical protein AEQU3_01458 [Aequorivita antarctica]